MTDWFRSWHGAPTDPKWRTIARRASVRPGDVAAIVWALMDRASQAAERGCIAGYDAEAIADALGYEPAEVERVITALTEKAVLIDDRFAAWEVRQPKREDDSAARVKAHREAKRNASSGDVTHCNAPEKSREDTEVETERSEQASIQLISVPEPKTFHVEQDARSIARSEGYSDAELDAIALRWPFIDASQEISELREWCDRMGYIRRNERKSKQLKAMKNKNAELAAAAGIKERGTGPPAAVIPVSNNLADKYRQPRH